MQPRKLLTTPVEKINERLTDEETIIVEVPKARMKRPFPLGWGLAALLLLLIFAVVTQLQFNRVNADNLFQAQQDTYQSDVRAYEAAVQAYETCLVTIDTRDTYRELFSGVSDIFETTANLPLFLFPDSENATIYRDELLMQIERLINTPVNESLKPKTVQDCPPFPTEVPEAPTR